MAIVGRLQWCLQFARRCNKLAQTTQTQITIQLWQTVRPHALLQDILTVSLDQFCFARLPIWLSEFFLTLVGVHAQTRGIVFAGTR